MKFFLPVLFLADLVFAGSSGYGGPSSNKDSLDKLGSSGSNNNALIPTSSLVSALNPPELATDTAYNRDIIASMYSFDTYLI